MDGRERHGRQRRLEQPAPDARYPELAAEQCLGGRCTEADERRWPNDRELGVEPVGKEGSG